MVPLPSQFPHACPHSYLVGAKSPSPRESPFSGAAKPQPHLHGATHRTNFTAALLPNARGAVQLPSCTGPCVSYSVLLVLPRRRPREPYRSQFTPAVVQGAGRLQLRIRPESWRCFRVAVDHRDIALSLLPVATTTALASPTQQLDLPTSPCRQIGCTLISNHFI